MVCSLLFFGPQGYREWVVRSVGGQPIAAHLGFSGAAEDFVAQSDVPASVFRDTIAR